MSTVGIVRLGSYFTDLCESIAASMIADPDQISLEVKTDDGLAEAEVSASFSLIVTELVINAIKHAFPGGRCGTIKVDYRSDHADWTLKVRDDGVGMPPQPGSPKGGLGSSIVMALAQQLVARVEIAGQPGTEVRIVHLGLPVDIASELVAAI